MQRERGKDQRETEHSGAEPCADFAQATKDLSAAGQHQRCRNVENGAKHQPRQTGSEDQGHGALPRSLQGRRQGVEQLIKSEIVGLIVPDPQNKQ